MIHKSIHYITHEFNLYHEEGNSTIYTKIEAEKSERRIAKIYTSLGLH